MNNTGAVSIFTFIYLFLEYTETNMSTADTPCAHGHPNRRCGYGVLQTRFHDDCD